jgi:hypothetical protein
MTALASAGAAHYQLEHPAAYSHTTRRPPLTAGLPAIAQVRMATLLGCAGFCIATIAGNAGRLIETAPLGRQGAISRHHSFLDEG